MKKIVFVIAALIGSYVFSQEGTVQPTSINSNDLQEVKKVDESASPEIKTELVHKEIIHLDWEEYFKTALSKSQKQKKPIVVFFTGSDWCGPCKQLHKGVFETKKFKEFADKYFILYKADFPRNKDLVSRQNKDFNLQLQKRFKQSSFPTVLVIDNNGNSLGQRNGLYDFDSYYPFFQEIIDKL